MTTHWLAEQMRKGYEGGTVQTLVGPDGTVWSVGDEVLHYKQGKELTRTKITTIFPGNGDWSSYPKGGDVDAVWFQMENGWMVRPWLLTKSKVKYGR